MSTQPFVLVPLTTYQKNLEMNRKHTFLANQEKNEPEPEPSKKIEPEPEPSNETKPEPEPPNKLEPESEPQPDPEPEPKKNTVKQKKNRIKKEKNYSNTIIIKSASSYKLNRAKKIIEAMDSHKEFKKFNNLMELIMQAIGTKKKELPNEKEFYELMFKFNLGSFITNTSKINQYFENSSNKLWFKI